jgi:hypothetical protein
MLFLLAPAVAAAAGAAAYALRGYLPLKFSVFFVSTLFLLSLYPFQVYSERRRAFIAQRPAPPSFLLFALFSLLGGVILTLMILLLGAEAALKSR